MIRVKAWMLGGVVVVVALTGCRRPSVAELDEQERRDPAIQAAWRTGETGNTAGAQAQYEVILKEKPDMARAHLDLAMLLLAAEERPVKAIHHFMRYQELRPDSEKRDLITRQIWYLTSLMGGKVAQSRVAALERELTAARAEIDALREGKPVPSAPAPTADPVPAPSATGRPRTYTVQPGDSLILIAQRVYGDGSKGRAIFEANRNRLKSMNAVQVGQTLVIPP